MQVIDHPLAGEFNLPDMIYDHRWPGERLSEATERPVEFLSSEWGWSRQKVRSFMDRCKEVGLRTL